MSNMIQCAKCGHSFEWRQAFTQQNTPGFHNPEAGDFKPRAFCPSCGSMIVEWDIDKSQDRNRWKWHGSNDKLNSGHDFPPDPLCFLGRGIPPQYRANDKTDYIDIAAINKNK